MDAVFKKLLELKQQTKELEGNINICFFSLHFLHRYHLNLNFSTTIRDLKERSLGGERRRGSILQLFLWSDQSIFSKYSTINQTKIFSFIDHSNKPADNQNQYLSLKNDILTKG